MVADARPSLAGRWLSQSVLALIEAYQGVLRPWLPRSCRFHPSCSDYGRAAIERQGVFKGTHLLIFRVCRCHPWNPGGYDPVPEER